MTREFLKSDGLEFGSMLSIIDGTETFINPCSVILFENLFVLTVSFDTLMTQSKNNGMNGL